MGYFPPWSVPRGPLASIGHDVMVISADFVPFLRGRGALALLAMPVLAIVLAAAPATAQDTPFAPPEVTVDLSVIDALPGIGQVNRGPRVVLHPPREAGAP